MPVSMGTHTSLNLGTIMIFYLTTCWTSSHFEGSKACEEELNLWSLKDWPLPFIIIWLGFQPQSYLHEKSCMYHPTTTFPTFAIVGSNSTMTMVANQIILNISVLILGSIWKLSSLNAKTSDCICLFMTHNKHHQMTCSEEGSMWRNQLDFLPLWDLEC